ncbi:unnamed protein product [Larinioides sclopetarius]|uniref:VWFC domain-containing protein n=1 Tax=Larinioides sclopetarius TaxID=280406 RepID=A0AAV1ZJS9_9ARAC
MGRTSPLKAGLIAALPVLLVIIIPTISAAPVQETSLSHDKGCFYMNKHHPSGEKIETNEPCLNCTCIGNTLMCYLRVCPFVKPLGENCVSEKHVGDCCPTFWCPQVYPHPTTETPDIEPRGCFLDGMYYDEGARIPMDPLKPCEVCYCIRNTSVCTMQICELEIDGCFPQYKPGSCCPSRYNCTEQAATTIPPGIMEPEEYEGCRVNGIMYKDGESVPSTDNCETCYCMKHEVVCAVQECTAPADNCVPGEIEEGQCCPTKYECPPTTGISDFLTTFASVKDIGKNVSISAEHTTLIPEISTTDLEGGARPLITMQDAGIKDLHISTVPTDIRPEVSTAGTEDLEEITTAALEAEVSELITETPSAENATFVTSDLVSRPREPKITEVPEDLFTSVTVPKVTGKPVFFPSRPIPGEGVCRHENKTYQSKEKVPSSDPCRLNCICVNSVVQCEQVECDLTPPESRQNCKIKKLPGECCPKYICDDSEISEEPTVITKETSQKVPEELLDEKKTTLDIRDISTDHRLETSLSTEGVTEPMGIDITTDKPISVEDISGETKETTGTTAAKEPISISSTVSPLVTERVEIKPTDLTKDREPGSLTTELPGVSIGISEEQTTETASKVPVTETEAAGETVAGAELDERKRTTTPSEEIEITVTTKKHISVTPSDEEETTEESETERTEESSSVPSTEFAETSDKAVSITSVILEKTTQQTEIEKADKSSATPLKDFEITAKTATPEYTTSSDTEVKTEKTKLEKTTSAGEEITVTTEKTVTPASVGEEKTTQESVVEKTAETSATPIKEMEFTTKTVKPVPSTPSDVHEITEKGETEVTRASVEFTEEPEEAVSVTSFGVEKTTQEAEIVKAVETAATPVKEFELTTMTGEHVPSTPSDLTEITEKVETVITTVSDKDFTEATEKPVSLTSAVEDKTTQEAETEKAVETSVTTTKEMELAGEPILSTSSDTKIITEIGAEITTSPTKDVTETTKKVVSLTSIGVETTTQEIDIEKAAETSVTPLKETESTATTVKPPSSTLSDEHKVAEEEETEATRSSVEFTEEKKEVSSTSFSVEKTTQQVEIEKAVETSATPLKELELTTSTIKSGLSTPSDVKETTEKAEGEITTVPAKDFTEATDKMVSLSSVSVEKTTQEFEIEKTADISVTPIKEFEFTVTTGKPVSTTLSSEHKFTEKEETEYTLVGVEITEKPETVVALTSVAAEKTTQGAEIVKASVTSATPIKESELTTMTGELVSSTRSDVEEITEKGETETSNVTVEETTEKGVSSTSVSVEKTTLEAEIEKAIETSGTPIKEFELSSTTSEYVTSIPSHTEAVTEPEKSTALEEEFTTAGEKAVSQTSLGEEKTTEEAEIEKSAETSVTPIKELEFTITTAKPVSSTSTYVKDLTEKVEVEITTVAAKDLTVSTEKVVSFTSLGVEKTTEAAEIEKAVETSSTPIKELETVAASKAVSSTPSDVKEITEMAEAKQTTPPGEELIESTEKNVSVSPTGEAKITEETTIEEVIKTSATPLKEFELTVTSGKTVSTTPSGEEEITEKEETEQTTGVGEFGEEKEKSVTPFSVAVEQTTPQAEIDKETATSVTSLGESESSVTPEKPVPSSTSGKEEEMEKAEVDLTTISDKEFSETTEKAVSLTSIDVLTTTQKEAEIEKADETSATTIKELKFTITTTEPYSSTPSADEEISEKTESEKTIETSTGPSREFTEAPEKAVSLTSVGIERTTEEAETEKTKETSFTPITELKQTLTTIQPSSPTPSIIEEITEKAEAEMSTVTAKEFSETSEKAISLTSIGEEKTTQEAEIEKAVETSTPIKELEFTITTSELLSSTPSGIEEISEKPEGVKTEGTSTEPSREFTEAAEKAVSLTSVEVDKTTIEAEIEKAGKPSTTIKELEFTVTTGKPVPSTASGTVEITEKTEEGETIAPEEALTKETEKAVSLTSIGVKKTTQEPEIEKEVKTSATSLKESKITMTTGQAISSTPRDVEEITEKVEGQETSVPGDRRTTSLADESTEHFTTASSEVSTPEEKTDSDLITEHFSVETGSSFDVLDLKKVTETPSSSEGTDISVTVSDEISLAISTTEIPVSKHVTEKESLTTSAEVHAPEVDEKRESVIPVSEGLPQTTSVTGAEEEAKFTISATTVHATMEKEIEVDKKYTEKTQSGLADISMTTALAIENQTVFSTTASTITMSDTSIKTGFTLTTLPTIKVEDITESAEEVLESQTTILVPTTVEMDEAELSTTSADKVTPTDHIERDSKIPVTIIEVLESTSQRSETPTEETITKSTFEFSEVTEKAETKDLPVSKVISTESITAKTISETLPTVESSTLFDLSQVSERDESETSAETGKEDVSPPLIATTFSDVEVEISKASDVTMSSIDEEIKTTTATSDVKITDQISTLGAEKTDLAIEGSTPGIKEITTDIQLGTSSKEVVEFELSTVTKSSEPEELTSEKQDKSSTEHILADKAMTTESQTEKSSIITDKTTETEIEISEKAVTEISTVESDKKFSTVSISTKVPEIEKTESSSEIIEFGITSTSIPIKTSPELEGSTIEGGAEEAETTIFGKETTESTILSDKAAPKVTTIFEKSTPSITLLVSDLSTLSEETDVVSDETTKVEITSVEGMKTSESIDIVSITDSQKTTPKSDETTGSLEVKDVSDQSVKLDSLLTTKETEQFVTPVSTVSETTEFEQQAEVSGKTTVTTSEAPKVTEFKLTTASETSKLTTDSMVTKLTTSIEEHDEEFEGTPSKEVEKSTTDKASEESEPEELFTREPITEGFSVTGFDTTFIPSKITLTTSKEVSGDISEEGETKFTTEGTVKTSEKISSVFTTSILSTESTTISDESLSKQTEHPKVFADEKATTIDTDLISKSLTTETPKVTEQKELGEKDTTLTSLLTTFETDAFSEGDLFESTTKSSTFKPDITQETQELEKITASSTVSLKTTTSSLSTKSEFTEEIVTKLPSETTEGDKFAEITTPAPSELSEKAASTEEVESEITTELTAITPKEEISTLSTKHVFTEDTVVSSDQTKYTKPSEISTVSITEFTPTTFETFDKTTRVKTTSSEVEEVSHVDFASTTSVSEVDKKVPKVPEFSTSETTSAPAESTSGIISTKLFEKELTTLKEHEAETTSSVQPEVPVSVTGVPPVKETTISSETTLEAEISTKSHVMEDKTISDISSTVASSEITASTPEDLTVIRETSLSKETTAAETDTFGEKQKETTGIEAVTKVTSLEEGVSTSTESFDAVKEHLPTKEALEPKIASSTIETVKSSEVTVEQKTSTSTFDLKTTTMSETKLFEEKELSTQKALVVEFSTLKPEHTSESVDLSEKSIATTPKTLTTESEDLTKTETSIIVEDTIQSNRTFAVDSMVVAHSTTPISESTTEAAEIKKEQTSAATSTMHERFDVSEDLLGITDTPSDLIQVTTQKELSQPQTFESSTIKVATTVLEKEASTTEKLEAFEGQTTLKEEIIQTVSTAVPSIPTEKAFSTEIATEKKAETHTEKPSEISHTPVITKEPSSAHEDEETTTFESVTEGREMKTTPSKVTETPQSTEELSLLTATTSVTEKALEAEVTTLKELATPSVSPKKGEDVTIEAHKETTSQTSFEFEASKEPSTQFSVVSTTSEQPSLIPKDISEKATTLPEELVTDKTSETIKEITERVTESSSITLKEEGEDHGVFSIVETEERTSPKSTMGTTTPVETSETTTFISHETIKSDSEKTATPEEREKPAQPEAPSSSTEYAISSSEAAVSTRATTTSPEKEEGGIESQDGEEKQVETSSILDESLISSTTEAKITSQPPGPVTDSTSSTATTTPEAVTEASTYLAAKAGVTALDEIEVKATTVTISTEDIGEAETATPEKSDCLINGTSYEDGEPIITVEPCEKCHCASGEIICFKIVCKIPKRGCVPETVNAYECCPTSYKCPSEEEATEIVTGGASSITEKDLSTPIPISFMFSTMPTSISTAILTSKSVEEEKSPADEGAASTEIPSSTSQITESTSPATEHTTVELSMASIAGTSEEILDISESPSTFKTIEITTESSRSTTTATSSESIPEVETEKFISEVESEVTVTEISKIDTTSTDEGGIEESATTIEIEKQSTKAETSETALITERKAPPLVEDKKFSTVSMATEETVKKLTSPISTTNAYSESEFSSTPVADVKAIEVGLEITTREPSFDIETKSVEPELAGEEEKTTDISITTEGKKLEITTSAATASSSIVSEFTSTPLTDVKTKEIGFDVTTGEPTFDVETKSVEPELSGEEEKTTDISITTEGKKLEITTSASTTRSSIVSEVTSTPLTDVKTKEIGFEVTTGEPTFDVETKSVEPELASEEEKTTEVSITTEGEKLKITTPEATISSSTVSAFTSTSLTDVKTQELGFEVTTGEPSLDLETKSVELGLTSEKEKATEVSFTTEGKILEIIIPEATISSSTVDEFSSTSLGDDEFKEVGSEITTEKPFLEVKTIPTETSLAEAEVTTLEETGSTTPKPVITEYHTTPEELKIVTDQVIIAKDEQKTISTTEIPETSSSSPIPISDEQSVETTSKEQESDMTTKSEVVKFTGIELTVTDKTSPEERSTEIVHDITESTIFTSESGEISSVDIKEIEAKSTATTLESKLSSIGFESTIEDRGAETTLSVESIATSKAPAAVFTSKFEVTDEFKDTEATEKETSPTVEEVYTGEKTTQPTEIKPTRESTESSATELMADKITKTLSTVNEETKAEGTTPFPESSMPTISSVSSEVTTEERATEEEELGISSKEPAIELETKSAVTEKSKDFETTTKTKTFAEEEVRTESESAIGVTEQTSLTTEVASKAETTPESGQSTISSLSTSTEKITEITGEAEAHSTEKSLSEITTKTEEAEKVTHEIAFIEKISTLEPGKKSTVTSETEAEVTETILSEPTTQSEEVDKATQETAFAEKLSTLEPVKKTTSISEESTTSYKGTEITGEAEAEVTEAVLSEQTTKSEDVEKVTQKTAFTESLSTLEPGKKATEFSEEIEKSLSTEEVDKMTTVADVSKKDDELKVTTAAPEAVTSPTMTVTSKFISDSLKTSETKVFDLTTSTETAEIQKETQKVEEIESTTKTTGAPKTLKPEETTKILEVMSSTSIPAKLPKLEDSITSTVRIPTDQYTSTEKVETTKSTLKVQDIDIATEGKLVLEDQVTTMHAEDTSEESATTVSIEFNPAKFTTSVTEAPELLTETTTSTSGEDLSGTESTLIDGMKFPSEISSKLTTLSQTVSTDKTFNDTALFETERPSLSFTSTLETLEDLKTTRTPMISTTVIIETDDALGKGLTEGAMIAKEESTITSKGTEISQSTSDITFQKTDVTKAFKAVPETTEKYFTTSTLRPIELKDAGITETDLIDTADKVESTDVGSTDFTSSKEPSTKPISDITTFSQEDEFSESLESFTETIQTNQTVISLSKESTPFSEDEHTFSPSDAEKEASTHLPQTSTIEGAQEGETTLQPKPTITLDQTITTDEIFKFVSTRFTQISKETKPTTEGLFPEVTLSSTTYEYPVTPKEVFTTKGPAIKALDVEISTHLPFEIKTTPKELEISVKDELATRTSTEQAPSFGLTEITSGIFTAKEELSTPPETQTKVTEHKLDSEMTEEIEDTSKTAVDQTLTPEIAAGVKQDVSSTTQTSYPSTTYTVSDKVDIGAEDEKVTEQDLRISTLVTEQPVSSIEGIEKITKAREMTGISEEVVSTITDIKKEFTISTTVSDELITKEKAETELFTKSSSLPEETSELFEASRITTSETHSAETTIKIEADEHLLTTPEPRQPETEISSQTTHGRTITTLSSTETEKPVSSKFSPITTSVDLKSETLATVKVPSMTDETDIEAKIASLTPLIKLDLTSTISSLITSTVEELSPSVKDQKTTTSAPEEAISTKESGVMTTTKPVVTGKETEISLFPYGTSSPIIQPEIEEETSSSEESKTETGIQEPCTAETAITEHELSVNITESEAESETEISPKSVTESASEVPASVTQTKESSTTVAEELSTKKVITLSEEEIGAQTTQESLQPFSPRRPAILPTDEIPSAKDLESSTQKTTEPPVQRSTELPTKGFKGIETTPLPIMTTLAAAIDNGTTPVDEDFLLDEGACIFEGQIYQSAEQIVRADPCEFCFCFRGDIICLQQSCPPPAPNCHRTMIHGYCCPRYDCPVLVTSRNISALQRRKGQVQPIIIQRRIEKRAIERTPVEVKGCQINGTFYEFGQTVAKSSGPCLHCLCENGGNMRCDPLKCRPQEPLLMKMNKPFFKTRR